MTKMTMEDRPFLRTAAVKSVTDFAALARGRPTGPAAKTDLLHQQWTEGVAAPPSITVYPLRCTNPRR
jgi:hypothetical protein